MRIPSRALLLRVLAWTLRALLLLILGGLVVTKFVARQRVGAARAEFAHVFGSADPAAWQTFAAPHQRNAARLLTAAAWALELRQGEDRAQLWEWRELPGARLPEILGRNRMALSLAQEAATVPYARFGYDLRPESPLPPLKELLLLGRLLGADARLAADRSDTEAALRSFRALNRLATVLEGEGPLVMHVVGVAIEQPAVELAASWCEEARPGSFLERVRDALPATELASTFRDARAREAMLAVRGVAGAVTDYGPAAVVLWPVTELVEAELLQSASTPVSLDEHERPWQRAGAPEPSLLRPHAVIAWSVGTGAQRHALSVALADAQRRLVRTALEVRMAGLSAGEYPAELPAGSPGCEADPLTRKPLRYVRPPDGTARLALELGPDLEQLVRVANPATVRVVLPPLPRAAGVAWRRGADR